MGQVSVFLPQFSTLAWWKTGIRTQSLEQTLLRQNSGQQAQTGGLVGLAVTVSWGLSLCVWTSILSDNSGTKDQLRLNHCPSIPVSCCCLIHGKEKTHPPIPFVPPQLPCCTLKGRGLCPAGPVPHIGGKASGAGTGLTVKTFLRPSKELNNLAWPPLPALSLAGKREVE